jgi:hypothetical protein
MLLLRNYTASGDEAHEHFIFIYLFIYPSGAHSSGYGSGTPEVPELPSAQGYSWATLSPGVINTETWSSRLGVWRGANNPTP